MININTINIEIDEILQIIGFTMKQDTLYSYNNNKYTYDIKVIFYKNFISYVVLKALNNSINDTTINEKKEEDFLKYLKKEFSKELRKYKIKSLLKSEND